jgi:hypothetical protein
MRDVMSSKETVHILKELIHHQHGIKSRLAREINESPQAMGHRIKSLCNRIENLDKEVHQMFFLLGYNVQTEYRIIKEREREEEIRDDPEYLRDLIDPETDPRAISKFKYYVERFLRDRSHTGHFDAEMFKESLKGRYKKWRKMGLSRLVDELEKLRHKRKRSLDSFYQLVSRFVEKEDRRIYNFGWLFSARGDSKEYIDFIERVKHELSGK